MNLVGVKGAQKSNKQSRIEINFFHVNKEKMNSQQNTFTGVKEESRKLAETQIPTSTYSQQKLLLEDDLSSGNQTVQTDVTSNRSFTYQSLNKLLILILLGLSILISIQLITLSKKQKVEAQIFGLKNDYETIVAQNDLVASVVPLPLENINLSQESGDKRVVALYSFLSKYNSPMASIDIASAFVAHADANGFGEHYTILPAISGIESGFGRIIPYNDKQISHNAWGWGGPGNWYYFDSWTQAVERISAGLAKGYGSTNMNPDIMVWAYCPPCAQSGDGIWQRQVKIYQNEIKSIEASL